MQLTYPMLSRKSYVFRSLRISLIIFIFLEKIIDICGKSCNYIVFDARTFAVKCYVHSLFFFSSLCSCKNKAKTIIMKLKKKYNLCTFIIEQWHFKCVTSGMNTITRSRFCRFLVTRVRDIELWRCALAIFIFFVVHIFFYETLLLTFPFTIV